MKTFLVFFFCFSFLTPVLAFAATNTFSIGVTIPDEEPPSTPSLLTVVPISSSQIVVDWSASTDNLRLGGYVLLRDGLAIATTSITSFSDSGLLANTLYAYEVYAFDTTFNLSSTSNSIATTTLALVPEPVVGTSTSTPSHTSTQTITLKDFKIETSLHEVNFYWSTTFPAGFVLRWGRTDAYQSGFITNENNSTKQWSKITELEPGTTYVYELNVNTPSGMMITLRSGQFTTKAESVSKVVPNVERLIAEVSGVNVSLKYFIPKSEPGALVQVVRSHLGFPIDLNDGAVIYTGQAESVRDDDALLYYQQQYYTVFVIGADGTVSSGAVVLARRSREVTDTNQVIFSPIEGLDTATSTFEIEADITISLISLNDINIVQSNKSYTFLDSEISLLATDPFTIRISRQSLPDNLKTIIITLLDPTDQRRSYSFLLSINKDGTAYEATFAPLNISGTSRLQITVYDYTQSLVGRYRKQISFAKIPVPETESVIFPDAFVAPLNRVERFLPISILIILILTGGYWLFGKRKRFGL